MPRKRNRTTTKASWTVDTLEKAVAVLRGGGISVYKVSQNTGIPYSTLKKRYNLAKADDVNYKNSPKLGRRTMFNLEQEKILANHLRTMSNKFCGLTREQFRKVCYDVAKQLGLEKRFNQDNQTAGKDWLSGFLQRHPGLSIRKPEAISINRILGFNKTEKLAHEMEVAKEIKRESHRRAEIQSVTKTGGKNELDKFKRRLIRAIARLMYKENKPQHEIWDELKKETGCDCENLWGRMRALTIKKLFRLLTAEDNLDNITKIAQLSVTDWLLYDLVLVHENVDVIGQDLPDKHEPKFLKRLFELVVDFGLENSSGESLVSKWFHATAKYNNDGKRQCSPMILQKRWYQLKELSRSNFYKFWFEYVGDAKKLEKAKAFKPTDLQMDIVKMYKTIVTKPFLSWEDLVKEKKVALPEDFERMRTSRKEDNITNENEPDLLVIETHVETIDLVETNDETNHSTNSDKKDNENKGNFDIGIVKVESLVDEDDISVLESVYIPLENTNISVSDNDIVTNFTNAHVIESNEENMPKITSVISTANFEPVEQLDDKLDESVSSIIEIDDDPQPKIDETDALSEQTETKHNIIEQIEEKEKKENCKETDELNKKLESDINKDNEKVEINDITDVAEIEVKKVDVKEKLEKSRDIKDVVIDMGFDILTDDLTFLGNGIEFEDDGIELIDEDIMPGQGINEEEDIEIDQKLLLPPLVYTKKLDDMDVFRFIDYNRINDMRVLENAYRESKPIYAKAIKIEDISKDRPEKDRSRTVSPELKICDKSDETDKSIITLASWHFRKPKVKSYNPIQLCKNPDFNKRLKRLSAAFFISERNRSMLNECMPLTIDVHKSFECLLVDNTLHFHNPQKDCTEETSNHIPVTRETDSPVIIECADDKQIENKEPPEVIVDTHIERNKVINLLDIDQIRRVNQGLKVAEVSPIVVSNTVHQTDDDKEPSSLLKSVLTDIPEKNIALPGRTVVTSENSLAFPDKTITFPVNTMAIPEKKNSIPDKTSFKSENTLTIPESNATLPTHSKDEINGKDEIKSISEVEVITQTDNDISIEKKHASVDVEQTEINYVENVVNDKGKSTQCNKTKSAKVKHKHTYRKPMSLSWYSKPTVLKQNSSDCLLASDTVERILYVCKDNYVPNIKIKPKKRKGKAIIQNNETKTVEDQNKEALISSVASEKNVKDSIDKVDDTPSTKIKKCKITINTPTTNVKNVCCWARQKIIKFTKINIGKHLCPEDKCICCCKDQLENKIKEIKMRYEARVIKSKPISKVSIGVNTEYDKDFEDQFATNLCLLDHQAYISAPTVNLTFGKMKQNISNESGCQTLMPSIKIPSPRRVSNDKVVDNCTTDKYKLPICLGKNKILLCSFKSIDKTSDRIRQGNEIVLPKGCQLVLLPNMDIALRIEHGIELDEEELSKVKTIMSSIQKQTNLITTHNTEEIPSPGKASINNETVINISDNETPNLDFNLNSEPKSSNSMEINVADVNNDTDISTTEMEKDTLSTTETPNLTDGSECPQTETTDTSGTCKKTILSDLMEMSGISADDVNIANNDNIGDNTCLPKILNVSSLSQSPAAASELQKGYKNASMRVTSEPIFNNSVVRAAILRCPELNIVSTFPELKYAYKHKAQFFKMDIDTGIIEPINVCIKKKQKKKCSTEKKSLVHASESIIDLTEETVDNDSSKPADNSVTKQIEIEQQSDSNSGENSKHDIKDPHNDNTPVKPIKMFKAIHPSILRYSGKSLLVRPIKDTNIQNDVIRPKKQKRKQDIRVRDTDFGEETESGLSSDDEPLSKKSKRIKSVPPNKNKEKEDREQFKKMFSVVDFNSQPRLEPIVFDDNDSQTSEDDCILGV